MKFIQACALVLLVATGATAQTIPSEPITLGGGRVVLGGDAALTVSPEDHGFFNYSDYEQTTLRQFRVGMTALFFWLKPWGSESDAANETGGK